MAFNPKKASFVHRFSENNLKKERKSRSCENLTNSGVLTSHMYNTSKNFPKKYFEVKNPFL